MQLIINTYGSYLRKNGNCFLVKCIPEGESEEKRFEVSVKKVNSIMITTSAYVSTDAIKFAMDNNIDIVFLDGYGDPYGRVWHSKLGSTVLIRRRQLEICEKETGLDLAKEWIVAKFDNQIDFLKRLGHSRPDKEEKINEYIGRLNEVKSNLQQINGSIEQKRGEIMGLEGTAGRTYFESLNFIMPERFKFNGRSRSPAKDEFNCLLNYGYGVLYSLVEKGCIIAGLDPYVGFVHTDNYNKKSLVFDLIEMFRIFVDQTVVYLFSQRKINKEYFDEIKNGLSLNKKGKEILLESLNKTLEESIRYKGRNIKRRNIIQFECHRIANELIKN